MPHTPQPKQAFFLTAPQIEGLYGGAAGGGKSDSLLMGALQNVDVPGYSALLLRKTMQDHLQPGSLIPRSFAWLGGTDASWNGSSHQWKFPSGAVIRFGYLDKQNDKYQYQSSEYQYIGFDELTQFRNADYRYLFSRLRKPTGMPVPLRMRAGSNPGGFGHEWVKRRFMIDRSDRRIFVPASLSDNPFLDRVAYLESLSNLDPLTRAQLERGDWTAKASGAMFDRAWFRHVVAAAPKHLRDIVRYWDLAASTPDDYDDPDWSAGFKVGVLDGVWYIMHGVRFQKSPKDTEDTVKSVAGSDGQHIRVAMEQEPGASGKSLISHYGRNVVPGFDFRGRPALQDKITRAGPFSSAAQRGDVVIVEGEWVEAFLDEVEAFPNVNHDDQVDAVTGAIAELTDFAGGNGPGGDDWSDEVDRDVDKYATAHKGRNTPLI